MAAAYIDKDPWGVGLSEFTDEELFLMVTENPAKMINHFDISAGEAGIGRIKKGAMVTIISATKLSEDPYTNLVRKVWAKDLNMVVIDGNLIYGNENYLSQAGISKSGYETLPMFFEETESFKSNNRIPRLAEKGSTKSSKMDHLISLGQFVSKLDFRPVDNCGFATKKGFVHQNSVKGDKHLEPFL